MEKAPQLYKIEEDLKENWVEDLASEGAAEAEEFLKKHAEFLIFLSNQGEDTGAEE